MPARIVGNATRCFPHSGSGHSRTSTRRQGPRRRGTTTWWIPSISSRPSWQRSGRRAGWGYGSWAMPQARCAPDWWGSPSHQPAAVLGISRWGTGHSTPRPISLSGRSWNSLVRSSRTRPSIWLATTSSGTRWYSPDTAWRWLPHAVETLGIEYLGYKAVSEEEAFGKGAKAVALADVPASAALDFACERADLALQLADRLRPVLAEQGLDELYRSMEMPLVPVLIAIEQAGVRVDVAALGSLSRHLETEMAAVTARIFELAGESFNINSPKQLGDILFE
jgi:hypothetical protein